MAFPAAAGAGGPALPTGRIKDPETGRIVSARLNPEIAAAVALSVSTAVIDAQRLGDAADYVPSPTSAGVGGGKRMQGGDRGSLSILVTAAIVAGAAYVTGYGGDAAVTAAGASGGAIALLASMVGESKIQKIKASTGEYLDRAGASKIADSLAKAGNTTVNFGDSALRLAFAVLRLPLAGTTAAVGVGSQLLKKVAEGAQRLSDKLESNELQEQQADLIIKNGTLAFTAALVALTASGAVSLMTIFSIMLWTGKLYASPVGRAVGIIELYLWWINQSPADQEKTKADVKAFVTEASKQAKAGKKVASKWVDANAPKITEAIQQAAAGLRERGIAFGEGFAEGIENPENPVINAMSLGFVRAASLKFDKKASPPTPEENESDLQKLAKTILKDSLGGQQVNVEKLGEAIDALKELQEGQEKVNQIRATLRAAKEELAEATEAAVALGVPSAAVAPKPGKVALPAVKASKRPTERVGPKEEAARRTSARGETRSAETAAKLAAVKAAERPTAKVRSAYAAAGAPPEGGRRRGKTRRRRIVRRKTKKTVTGFYY